MCRPHWSVNYLAANWMWIWAQFAVVVPEAWDNFFVAPTPIMSTKCCSPEGMTRVVPSSWKCLNAFLNAQTAWKRQEASRCHLEQCSNLQPHLRCWEEPEQPGGRFLYGKVLPKPEDLPTLVNERSIYLHFIYAFSWVLCRRWVIVLQWMSSLFKVAADITQVCTRWVPAYQPSEAEQHFLC